MRPLSTVLLQEDGRVPTGMTTEMLAPEVPMRDPEIAGLRLLADASLELSRSLDVDTTLATAVRFLATLGDVVLVDVDEGYGGVRRAIVSPTREATIERAPGAVPALGGIVSFPDVASAASMSIDGQAAHLGQLVVLGAKSAIAAPLVGSQRAFGSIWVGSSGGEPIDGRARQLVWELSQRIAVSLENARAHQAVLAASRGHDQMLYVLSHDLRNPLSNIHMASDELLHRAPEDCHRHLEIIRRASRQMNRLIQDVLDLTRLESGRFVMDRGEHDLAAAVRDAVAACEQAASLRGVEVLVDAPHEVRAHFDRDKITHVVVKLLDNAIKATDRGGKIAVGAHDCGEGEARIVVTDPGKGMDAEQLRHAFDRSYHAQRKDRRGPGLGLAVARGTVEAHGGALAIASEVGKGTRVTVTLPSRAR